MNYRRIAQLEREFVQSPVYNIKQRTIGFGNNETLEVYECEPKFSPLNYFYQEEFEKKRIVLHFTAGHLQGDIPTLTGGRGRVSVPFVIARDGKIYRLFSSKYWSYHLGPGALGGNTTESQKTIGIELSNFGPLFPMDDKLYCWTNVAYCTLQETKQYVKLGQVYRNQLYFATFTEAQYASLQILLRYLCHTYDIPWAFLPTAQRFITTPAVLNISGIVSHVNYRVDKTDIGPAFNWDQLIRSANTPSIKPRAFREMEVVDEAELDKHKIFANIDTQPALLEGLGI